MTPKVTACARWALRMVDGEKRRAARARSRDALDAMRYALGPVLFDPQAIVGKTVSVRLGDGALTLKSFQRAIEELQRPRALPMFPEFDERKHVTKQALQPSEYGVMWFDCPCCSGLVVADADGTRCLDCGAWA